MEDIEKIIEEYREAKIKEEMAIAARVNIGARLAERLGVPDDEKQKTYSVCGHKITIKQPVNRSVDWKAFSAIQYEHPPIRSKPSLDVKGLKWLRDNEPEVYKKFAKCITEKPGRVSVSISAGVES